MERLQKSIHQWLIEHKEDATLFLSKLIQCKSVAGQENEAQRLIEEKLNRLSFSVDKWIPGGAELLNSEYFSSPRTDFSESPNVVGVLQGSGGGKSIILNGHIDVVPEGDLTQWHDPPFNGTIVDNKVYGRGSTDMKGGTVALLLAVEALQALDIQLKGDVIFQSVIEEESGGAGTLACLLRGYKADAALIPEPTELKLFPKQQGSLWFRIKVKGKAAHGGTRYEGVSAIDKAMTVIQHIRELEVLRNKKITDPLYRSISIPIPINIGTIEGGKWPSSVPDLVTIEGRMGVAPEEAISDAKQEMEDSLINMKRIDTWFSEHPPEIEWFGARWVPGSLHEAHPLVKLFSKNVEAVTGDAAIVEASPWGTDGGLFTKVGNIPTLIFGPGTTKMAHYPNEYIEVTKVFEAAEVIALALMEWCEIAKKEERDD